MSVVKIFEHNDSNIRFSSSSGGLFSELASRVFKDSGVVFGAVFTANWQVKHICARNEAQLDRMRKSKYAPSHLEGVFEEVENYLKLGTKVLFTGVPCQIASLKKRLGTDYENLLTAEIVCHGNPREDAWNSYLKNLLIKLGKSISDIKSIDFRDKTDGWDAYRFTIEFKDGSRFSENAMENLFMRMFINNYIIKSGCFVCAFKNTNSKADITMGDFWGMKFLMPDCDRSLGTSIVISNTKKGDKFLSDLNFIAEFNVADVAKYNHNIVGSSLKPDDYDYVDKKLKEKVSLFEIGERIYNPPIFKRIWRKLRGKLANR